MNNQFSEHLTTLCRIVNSLQHITNQIGQDASSDEIDHLLMQREPLINELHQVVTQLKSFDPYWTTTAQTDDSTQDTYSEIEQAYSSIEKRNSLLSGAFSHRLNRIKEQLNANTQYGRAMSSYAAQKGF